MSGRMSGTTVVMKKPPFPLWIVAFLVLLVGGLVAMNAMNSKNVTVYPEHDHDHDGKPDHGEGAH